MTAQRSKSFVIGDVHACLPELQALLNKIGFRKSNDRIIFTGDLVGRGPYPLETLEFIMGLGPRCVNVMGNHDLRLILQMVGPAGAPQPLSDTFDHSDKELCRRWRDAIKWLMRSPFLYDGAINGVVITHAGISPQLPLNVAIDLARDVEKSLRRDEVEFCTDITDLTRVENWNSAMSRSERVNFAVASFTRMRFCYPDGTLNFCANSSPSSQRPHLVPWFNLRASRHNDDKTLIFGHWATLGLHRSKNAFCCDTGCVFGGLLTAIDVSNDFTTTSVPSCFNALSEHNSNAEMRRSL